jgi:hypothetical protein
VLGDWIVTKSSALDDVEVDPMMLDLLRWHGSEEVEHRAVAFDLFNGLGGGYLGRITAMVVVFPVFVGCWIAGMRYFMRHDPLLPDDQRRVSWRAFRAAGQRGTLPTLELILRAVPRYLSRSYHPSQEGDTAAAVAYLATSPAVA